MSLMIPWYFYLIVFFYVSLIVTIIIKRKAKNAKTWLIASMIRTKKHNKKIDELAKKFGWIEQLSTIGIILGFGAIGLYYLLSKKNYSKAKKYSLLLLGTIILGTIFYLLFGISISGNFFTQKFGIISTIVFALAGFAGFTIAALVFQATDIVQKTIEGKKSCPGVAPLIPGVQIPNVPIFIPLHAWLSLLIILILHEGFHGIMARRTKTPLKNTGIILLGFLPIGAFVEPDEKKFEKKKEMDKLKVYSAGPTANIFTFFVLGLLLFGIIVPLAITPFSGMIEKEKQKSIESIIITKVEKQTSFCGETFNAPAYGKLEKGMKVIEINGKKAVNLNQVRAELAESKGKEITLKVLDKNGKLLEKKLKQNTMGLLGITMEEKTIKGYKEEANFAILKFIVGILFEFFVWFAQLSFLVGMANFIPIEPFDGGKMAKIIAMPLLGFWKKSEKEKAKLIQNALLILVLALIAVNVFPLFL